MLKEKLLAILLLISITFWPASVLAEGTPTPTSENSPTPTPTPTPDTSALAQKLFSIQQEEIKVQQELSRLGGQKKSLSSQIGIINNNIQLTSLKIQKTQAELNQLESEIGDLSVRLDNLQLQIADLGEVLQNRIQATYKNGNIGAVEMIFSSSGFYDFISRFKYLQLIQAHDKKVLYQMQVAKSNFTNQKEILEEKRIRVATLKADLDAQNAQLAKQKSDKEQLLAVTKNDEKTYQGKLAELQADAASISKALGNITAKIGPVKRGDVIAGVGSTGCSTGPHLHFEVYNNAKVSGNSVVDVNTEESIQFKVSSHLVNPHNYLDNGTFVKPVPDYPGNITTEFLGTSIFGTPHTGIDVWEPYGTPIVAADSGTAYIASATCLVDGKVVLGGSSVGRGVIIDHDNGLVTLYWHIP